MPGDPLAGYQGLAAAVIEQTVRDVTGGAPERRKAALAAIRAGGLAPWLDLLCENYDVYECLTARLHKLARENS